MQLTEASSERRPAASRTPERGLVSVVIPVLNEESGLEPLLGALLPVLEGIGHPFEVVFVDDGSTDRTLDVLRQRHAADPRIKAISFSRNFGKEIALAAGLRYAKGEAVIAMDADLQHPPATIPEFLARWREGYDVVYGQRIDRAADTPLRRFLAKVYYATFRQLSGTRLHENAGDFRLMSRRAVDAMNRLDERARFNKGLFAWIGFKSIGLPFQVGERREGPVSRWRLRRLWHFAIDGIASFSTIPLRIWSYVGLVVSLFAFGYAVIFLVKTLVFGSDMAGFPTLVISILMLSGIQLISLGVIGEYLGRVFEEVKARPLFLVAEEIGVGGQERGMQSPAQMEVRADAPAEAAEVEVADDRRRPAAE
ncbi:MAG: glycosyltransferase family 2 protein [Hyphomicrobiaceae bacterium]|nr:glycosyltransferase family 2 protein [Hyphomicrobiaceae bacterium]